MGYKVRIKDNPTGLMRMVQVAKEYDIHGHGLEWCDEDAFRYYWFKIYTDDDLTYAIDASKDVVSDMCDEITIEYAIELLSNGEIKPVNNNYNIC